MNGTFIHFYVSETVKLVGEGEYNLNVLKQIKVTDSFLKMNEDVKGCQDKEPLHNCTTRQYVDSTIKTCGCLPLNMRINDDVSFMLF